MKKQAEYAKQYADTSDWQYLRGSLLLNQTTFKKGETVLDLGCGTGQLTFEIAKKVGQTGKVFAIDPDNERLKIAQTTIPQELKNIIFLKTKAEQLNEIADESIDVIYSNYVIHWIPDKIPMFQEAIRCLRPNGSFVMEFVGELMPFLHYVTSMLGERGQAIINKFFCFSQNEWVKLFKENSFIVENADWPDLYFEYNDLNDFFDWWEGTTHGGFQRDKLSVDSMLDLQNQFPGKVSFDGNAFQAVVRKKD